MHPYLAGGPIAIAHRGGAEEFPENTMAAFASAVAMGYVYLETDVHVTSDGVLTAFHDGELDRVTDRAGRIEDLDIATVEKADAAYWFTTDCGLTYPARGKGHGVPRLESLLQQFPTAKINIDPKKDSAVAPLIALLDRLQAWDRVCIGSFSDRRLRTIRKLSGGRACTSMGPREVTALRLTSLTRRPGSGAADCVQIPTAVRGIRLVDKAMIQACHRRGLPVHVWTVNERPEMERLLDLGVDGIMTDRPRELAEAFRARNLSLVGGRTR